MSSALLFIKKQPIITVLLILLVSVAAFTRLWQLSNSFHFLGDQGRDALTVSRMFTDRDLVFIGPVTSVGNMYLGPFYYYFMLPFLFLSYPSPMGPVYAVAVVNIVTILLMYVWGKHLVGSKAAMMGAWLMAISYSAVTLSRFSWNPNIIPFFALLLFYAAYMAWKKDVRWWVWVGIAFSVLIQLHYVTILSGAAMGIIWLVQLFQLRKNWKELRRMLIFSLIAMVIFLVSLLPLMLFDSKHQWANAQAFQSLLSSDENFVQQSSGWESFTKVMRETHGRSMHILFEFNVGKNRQLNTWLVTTVIAILLFSFYRIKKQKTEYKGITVITVALIVGILGLSFYEHNVYDHYISYLFPATFLVLGFCLDRILAIKYLGVIPVAVFIVFFAQYNLPRISFNPGGPTQQQLQTIAAAIHQKVEPDEPYSIVLLSDSGDLYGMNYQYYLSTDPHKRPLKPEEHHQAKKLFIINEDKKSERPQELPIYEIVVFGNSSTAEVFEADGLEITQLSKDQSQ